MTTIPKTSGRGACVPPASQGLLPAANDDPCGTSGRFSAGRATAQGVLSPARKHIVTTTTDASGRHVRTCAICGVVGIVWSNDPPADATCPNEHALAGA